MANVSSLWIGSELSIPHKIALSSFLYYGHKVKLYVYDMNLDVPSGVIKENANNIIPFSEVFLHYGKYAAFSDYFRYAMIQKTNEMWVDADTICLSELFFDDRDYVFLEEAPKIYNGTLLKMPADSTLSRFLNKKSKALKGNNVSGNTIDSWDVWTYIGPKLVTEGVCLLSLQDKSVPAIEASVIEIHHENPFDLLWNPKNTDSMLDRIGSATCLTYFNSWIDQKGFDKNQIPEGSVMQLLYSKFIGK